MPAARHGCRPSSTISAWRSAAVPARGLARRLLMPVSKDTLLRTVRARAPEAGPASRVIGIDDWAWKRGHRYGSIVCDLERREIVDVLPRP